jgi:hypothetical protein
MKVEKIEMLPGSEELQRHLERLRAALRTETAMADGSTITVCTSELSAALAARIGEVGEQMHSSNITEEQVHKAEIELHNLAEVLLDVKKRNEGTATFDAGDLRVILGAT